MAGKRGPNLILWRDAEPVLVRDGSLWDIYVRDTIERDWEHVLDEVVIRGYRHVFSISGREQPLPSAADALNAISSLFVWVDGVQFNTHFARVEEIAFDVHPKRIHDQESLNRVANFMMLLGDITGKIAGLSPDNLHDFPFISYDPNRKQFKLIKQERRVDSLSDSEAIARLLKGI
jgi:hypothetical protein